LVTGDARATSPTVPLQADEPAFDGYRRVLANLAATIVLNQPGAVAEVDPEYLHELRVAVRRTRSILSQSRRVLPDDVRDAQRKAFGWLGVATGPARDLDVYALEWPTYVRRLPQDDDEALRPVCDAIERRRRSTHATLAKDLTGDRYQKLMARWTSWLAEPAPGGPAAADPLGRIVASRIRKAQRGVLRDGRAIHPESPAERLHDLRKDAKKLRYLLECFGSLFEPKPRKAFVKRLKALQDNLGEHQDAEVHAAQLRDIARRLDARKRSVPTETTAAIGRLTEHLEQRGTAARAEFHERFVDYDAKATAAALDVLLGGIDR
jgi:CHAD domain-containing protein